MTGKRRVLSKYIVTTNASAVPWKKFGRLLDARKYANKALLGGKCHTAFIDRRLPGGESRKVEVRWLSEDRKHVKASKSYPPHVLARLRDFGGPW